MKNEAVEGTSKHYLTNLPKSQEKTAATFNLKSVVERGFKFAITLPKSNFKRVKVSAKKT